MVALLAATSGAATTWIFMFWALGFSDLEKGDSQANCGLFDHCCMALCVDV